METLTDGGLARKALELLMKVTTCKITTLASSLSPVVVNGLCEFLAIVKASPALTLVFFFPLLQIYFPMCYIESFPECTLEHILEYFLELCVAKCTH